MIALSAVQSSRWVLNHNAILSIAPQQYLVQQMDKYGCHVWLWLLIMRCRIKLLKVPLKTRITCITVTKVSCCLGLDNYIYRPVRQKKTVME